MILIYLFYPVFDKPVVRENRACYDTCGVPDATPAPKNNATICPEKKKKNLSTAGYVRNENLEKINKYYPLLAYCSKLGQNNKKLFILNDICVAN